MRPPTSPYKKWKHATSETDWMADGKCYESGLLETFFSSKAADQAMAKALCRSCPAKQACLDYSINYSMTYGIWGGYDEIERAEIAAGRPLPRTTICPTCLTKFTIGRNRKLYCSKACQLGKVKK